MRTRARAAAAASAVLCMLALASWTEAGTRVLLRSGDADADGTRLGLFAALVATGPRSAAFVGTTSALMVKRGGGLGVVARTGDPLPPPLTGTFNDFLASAIDDAGAIAFHAELNSPAADEGLFLSRGGAIVTIATGFAGSGLGEPEINARGEVAYLAGGSLFVWDATSGAAVRLVGVGDPAPGGGTFARFARARPAINDSGVVAFRATVDGGSPGVFTASRAGGVVRVALTGALATSPAVAIDELGEVAFVGEPPGGSTAVFLYDPATGVTGTVARVGDAVGAETLAGFDAEFVGVSGGRVAFEGLLGRRGRDRKLVLADGASFTVVAELPKSSRFATGLTSAGHVVWAAGGALFRFDGAVTKIVSSAEATPIGAAVTATAPAANDLDAVVFTARHDALYRLQDGRAEAMVRAGEVLPGAGTIVGFDAFAVRSDVLVFFASLVDGGAALAVATPDGPRKLVARGDPSPGGGAFFLGDTEVRLGGGKAFFFESGDPFGAALRTGRVTRVAAVPGQVVRDSDRAGNLVLRAGGTRVAVTGERAPGTRGARFLRFGSVATSGGTVLFGATIEHGAQKDGLFLRTRRGITKVVVEGERAPGGGTFAAIDVDTGPVVLRQRTAGFYAQVDPGDGLWYAGLFAARGGAVRLVARVGGPSPIGGTIGAFASGDPLSIVDGAIVYQATLVGGTGAGHAILATSLGSAAR